MSTEDIFTSALSELATASPFSSRTHRCRRNILARLYERPLRRVNVLQGHTGCVNALSWANGGELLLSGGDDTRVRIWAMRQGVDDLDQEYPFVCNMEIDTGHVGNIFATQMLPSSSRLVSVARDKQVRVFDIESTNATGSSSYQDRTQPLRVIRCHTGAVKRIVTESSPDSFLTVSEDGSVRQHDLRAPQHICKKSGRCPPPLVKLRHQLFSMSLSPLKPYQFVVAGDAPHGYLFDRRQIGRFLDAEWGMPVNSDNMTTCVRRFARRRKEGRDWMDYITGTKMAQSGNELILSYAGDSIYSFDTNGETLEAGIRHGSPSPILPPNAKRRKVEDGTEVVEPMETEDAPPNVDDTPYFSPDPNAELEFEGPDSPGELEEPGVDEEEDGEEEDQGPESHVPLILPKLQYRGVSNVRTIKDVNYLGPSDEFVVSGSEDGNFFVYKRSTGVLHGIYEGDSSVVNVIEGHPYLPLVAVSGLDHTVKLFSPREGHTPWSKTSNATAIMARNTETVATPRFNVQSLLQTYGILVNPMDDDDVEERCTYQ